MDVQGIRNVGGAAIECLSSCLSELRRSDTDSSAPRVGSSRTYYERLSRTQTLRVRPSGFITYGTLRRLNWARTTTTAVGNRMYSARRRWKSSRSLLRGSPSPQIIIDKIRSQHPRCDAVSSLLVSVTGRTAIPASIPHLISFSTLPNALTDREWFCRVTFEDSAANNHHAHSQEAGAQEITCRYASPRLHQIGETLKDSRQKSQCLNFITLHPSIADPRSPCSPPSRSPAPPSPRPRCCRARSRACSSRRPCTFDRLGRAGCSRRWRATPVRRGSQCRQCCPCRKLQVPAPGRHRCRFARAGARKTAQPCPMGCRCPQSAVRGFV